MSSETDLRAFTASMGARTLTSPFPWSMLNRPPVVMSHSIGIPSHCAISFGVVNADQASSALSKRPPDREPLVATGP